MAGSLLAVKGGLVSLFNRIPKMVRDWAWLNNAYVAVGWQGPEKYPDGTLVASVAVFNEFGTFNEDGSVRVPARPFMRPAYAENRPAILSLRQQVVAKVNAGSLHPEKALDIMGYRMMLWVRKKILSNLGPPLAASTLARKRAEGKPAVTLINTRQMLDSLTYHIYLGRFGTGKQTDNAKSAQAQHKATSLRANQAARERMQKIRTAAQTRREKIRLREKLKQEKGKAKAKAKRDKARARVAERKAKQAARDKAKRDKDRVKAKAASDKQKAKIKEIRQKFADKRKAYHDSQKTKAAKKKVADTFERARKGIAAAHKNEAAKAVRKHYGYRKKSAKKPRTPEAKQKARDKQKAKQADRKAKKDAHVQKVAATQKATRTKKLDSLKQKQNAAEQAVRDKYSKGRKSAQNERKLDKSAIQAARKLGYKGTDARQVANRIRRLARKGGSEDEG